MSSLRAASAASPSTTPDRLRHVRWLVGGTGSGKTTAATELVRRFNLDIYPGDRAEHDWLTRCSADRHPRFAAHRNQRPGDMWRGRTAEQVFTAMASRYGETINFLVEDLLARPANRAVLVDYFGVQPRDLAPLLSWPEQAVVLIPTPTFRRVALTRRYSDPARAHANWGGLDPAEILEKRLARDALWDAEVTDQAIPLGLPVITIDGNRPVEQLADELGAHFRLNGST